MKKYRIKPFIDGSNQQHNTTATATALSDLVSLLQKVNDTLTELFCKKNAVVNQVVVGKDPQARKDRSASPILRRASVDRNLRSSLNSRTSVGGKSVRFHGDPPSSAQTVRSSTALTIFQNEFENNSGMEP